MWNKTRTLSRPLIGIDASAINERPAHDAQALARLKAHQWQNDNHGFSESITSEVMSEIVSGGHGAWGRLPLLRKRSIR